MERRVAVAPVAASQLGLFTRAQAEAEGLSRHQLYRAVHDGELRRLFPTVFADAAAPSTWEQSALAAALAAGRDAVLSHRSAAAVHRLRGSAPPVRPVEVSVPAEQSPRVEGVVVHRVILPPGHRMWVGPVPVATVARALVDATGFRTASQLEKMVDDALVRGLTTLADIDEVLEALESCRGRRLARMRCILAVRGPEAERAESRPELQLHRAIVDGGLPAPVQQHWVVADGERFRLDLAYPALRLGIEYLGFDPHRSRSSFGEDFHRDRLLTQLGWRILYFTATDSDAEIVRSVGSCISQR